MKRTVLLLLLPVLLFVVRVIADPADERRHALRQLEERAEAGDPKALFDLASLYDTGYDSIPIDSLRSSALYRMSAEKGYAPAQNYLGFRYFNGEAIRQDVDSALYWLAKAAGQGDIKAANNLGFLLANSEIVSRDYPQAIYWLSRAADAGLPTAGASLADLFRQGLGTEPDTLKAVELYTKAIQGGLQDAELKLLSMMGRKWETLPADSAATLGKFYYTHGAPFIGVTLFENAASDDNPLAYTFLGDAFSRGIGAEYNHDKSLEYFLRGALGGNHSAQFVIGELLDMFPDALTAHGPVEILKETYGESLPPGIDTADYWYERAAEGGINDGDGAYKALFE